MSKLTRAEKNAIIINESKGIQHPDYYVCHTKNGDVQVRKRKKPLNVENSNICQNETTPSTNQIVESPIKENNVNNEQPQKETISYEAITNKQLLEKMLLILEKNVVSNNKDLNDPERERETEDNKQFIEGVKTRAEQLNINKESQPVQGSKSENSKSEIKTNDNVTNQPVINPSSANSTNRRSRQLINQSSKPNYRKGRNLF